MLTESDDAPVVAIDGGPDDSAIAVGDRVRVTHTAGGSNPLRPGATGTVTYVYATSLSVEWDDHELNRLGVALMQGLDRWERIDG